MRACTIIALVCSIATTQFFTFATLYFLFYAEFERAFSCLIATFFSAILGKTYAKISKQLIEGNLR